jgi:enoyl-CoA hydratase/carnithine racemase
MTSTEPESDADGRITYEADGHVRLIGLDRPAKYNGFTPKMLRELAQAYTDLENDPDARAAVLFAHGDNFTAGLDLPRVSPLMKESGGVFPEGMVDPMDLYPPLRSKPLVTAVRGYCYTIGIELMLAGDIVVAGAETRFRQHEGARGVMAAGGATVRFHERAGWGNAMRWLLTGDEFDAVEARRIGFVQEITAPGMDIDRATEIARTIAAQAPLATVAMRDNARKAQHEGLPAAIAEIRPRQQQIMDTEDALEGLRSFQERRPGDFKGR